MQELVVLVAALFVALSLILFPRRHRTSDVKTYELSPDARIEIDVDNGNVRIISHENKAVYVDLTMRYRLVSPRVESMITASGLRLRARRRAVLSGRSTVDLHVAIPRTMSVVVRAGRGRVDVNDVDGDVTVRSDVGLVTMEHDGGALRLETTSGGIDARDLTAAEVVALTDDGPIELRFRGAPARVDATTGKGAIEVAVPPVEGTYQVDAFSEAGGVSVTVPTDASSLRSVVAHSAAGDVWVHAAPAKHPYHPDRS